MEIYNQAEEEQAQELEQGRRQDQRDFNIAMSFTAIMLLLIALVMYVILTSFI